MNKAMKPPKKKDFKAVCILCMNGSLIRSCPSKTCILAPIKDGKPFRGSRRKLKEFCKACDPEGYNARAFCQTVGNCPLEGFLNHFWAKKIVKGLTYISSNSPRKSILDQIYGTLTRETEKILKAGGKVLD